ncbi:hypothetical protein [Devosia sp. DBB001]|nr:hypothetical protein [Devosia sp. DBB001]
MVAVALLVMLIALFAGAGVYLYWQRYNDTLHNIENRAQASSQLVAVNAQWVIETARQSLRRIDEVLGAEMVVTSDKVGALREAVTSLPQNVQIFVLDAVGNVRYADDPAMTLGGSASTDYFSRLQAGNEWYISPLLIGADKQQFFVVGKRIARDGQFVGVAVVSIPASLMAQIWASLQLGPNSTTSLATDEGDVVTRFPAPEGSVDLRQSPLFTTYLPKAAQGTYVSTSVADGVERIVGYHRVEGTNLVAIAAIALAPAMRDFWSGLTGAAFFATPVLLALLVAAAWIGRLLQQQREAEEVSQRLAAIVESSDDAILSKDLNGVIETWNAGAERLFGYAAEEAVGQPVTMLIPEDRLHEEPTILSKIRRGERVDHHETIRRRKDGTMVDVSLSISPVYGPYGVIGASKIARDITQHRRQEEQMQMLLREMNHRIKNLFTLAGSIVAISARSATSPTDLAQSVSRRMMALSNAHALTMSSIGKDGPGTTFHTLLKTIFAPYASEDGVPVVFNGDDFELGPKAVTHMALLMHEFATNSAKYGALSVSAGRVEISSTECGDDLEIVWRELGGPAAEEPRSEGFGSLIGRATAMQMGGAIERKWGEDGLTITVKLARAALGQ